MLDPALARCRRGLPLLARDLRARDGSERRRAACGGVPLALELDDLADLDAAGRLDLEPASTKALVSTSAALVVLWGELLEGSAPDAVATLSSVDELASRVAAARDAVRTALAEPIPLGAERATERRALALSRAEARLAALTGAIDAYRPAFARLAGEGAPTFDVRALVDDAVAELRSLAASTGLDPQRIGLGGSARRTALTARESAALVAERWPSAAGPAERICRLTAGLSYVLARDTRTLELPKGYAAVRPSPRSFDAAKRRAATAAVAALLEDARRTAIGARRKDLAETFGAIGERLAALERTAAATAPAPDGEATNGSPVELGVTAAELAEALGDHVAVPPPGRDGSGLPASQSPSDSRRAAIPWGRLAVALAAVALIAGAAASAFRTVAAERQPVRARPVDREALRRHLPSVVVPSTEDPAASADPRAAHARIGVGPEWTSWSDAERRQRLAGAATVLADGAWRGATFFDATGRTVARWERGAIVIGPSNGAIMEPSP